jgi:hypothetical protein
MDNLTGRVQQLRDLISGISEDADKILSMIQMSAPLAQAVIDRFNDRTQEARDIFEAMFPQKKEEEEEVHE